MGRHRMESSPSSCKFFTAQFQLCNLSFRSDNVSLVASTQSGKYQWLFIAYRLLWAVWWTGFLAYRLYRAFTEEGQEKWAMFMTNQGLILIVVSSLLQFLAAVSLKVPGWQGTASPKLQLFYQVVWAVFELACPLALSITLIYWIAVNDGSYLFDIVLVHTLNSGYVFADVCFTGMPIRLLHAYLAIIYGTFYGLLSLICQLGTGMDPVYTILDFHTRPGLTVGTCFMALGLTVFNHALLFFCYWIRLILYRHCCVEDQDEKSMNGVVISEQNEILMESNHVKEGNNNC